MRRLLFTICIVLLRGATLPFRLIALMAPGGHPGVTKLYHEDGSRRDFWETWHDGQGHVILSGEVGREGEMRTGLRRREVRREMRARRRSGFAEIHPADLFVLEVVWRVEGLGTPEDSHKVRAAGARINALLGLTGLGHLDAKATAPGEIELCCLVVDPDRARRAIEDDLAGTEFGDYARLRVLPPTSRVAEIPDALPA